MRAMIAGHITLLVGRIDEEPRVVADFDNLITDAGLDRIGTGPCASFAHVGSGNAAPAVSDTGLATPIARSSTLQSSSLANTSIAPYYSQATRTFRFAPGVATGTVREVGIGWANSNSNLFSRALVVDADGALATVVVAADEYLDLVYRLRVYPPTATGSGTLTIAGSSHSYSVKAARVTNTAYWSAAAVLDAAWSGDTSLTYDGAIGATIADGPGGSGGTTGANSSESDGHTLSAYVNGNHYRDAQFDWGATRGNLPAGYIRTVLARSHAGGVAYQVEFNPTLAKTSANALSLPLRFSWSRHS